MPSEYYTFREGPAAFFALDARALVLNNFRPASEQSAWLDDELAKSDAPWKFVFGKYVNDPFVCSMSKPFVVVLTSSARKTSPSTSTSFTRMPMPLVTTSSVSSGVLY